jgi:pimeloyl-ACP methyl ester carboxylesterase
MRDEIEIPTAGGVFRELAAVTEFPRLALSAPRLAGGPPGRGAPVLVLPGFGAGDGSTLLLRGYLRALGYAVHGWGLGRNGGDVPELIPRVAERTERIAERAGRPVRLVGWSLGGVLGRETTRDRPELVERVVTLGTPVVGGPKYTLAGASYARRGVDLDEIERQVEEREAVPIARPVTAIYSRNDAVVAWKACIDRYSTDVEHVEVEASHAGLGFSARVWEIVAERLSRGLEAEARTRAS